MFADRAHGLLDECLALADGADGLDELRAGLRSARRRVGEPMRLAVVGQIKKGKSTLVNALLGEHVVATGALELTFNVNELRWTDGEPTLVVHFKDGRTAERSLAELETLTARDEANRELLAAIRTIEVCYPNELLRRFVLVDTPGLNSVFDTDSRNTLAYLGRTPDDIEADSTAALSAADALVYVFTRAFAASDRDLVAEFGGTVGSVATPLKAVAALNRCEAYWHPVQRPDPLAVGKRIVERYLDEAGVRRLFFAIRPVCALLAAGAQTLHAAELQALVELTRVPPEALTRRVRDAQLFATAAYDDLPVPAGQRARLVRALSNYGVHLACQLLRDGVDAETGLAAELFARSGVAELRDLCTAHFGNRATLIKFDGAMREVMREVRGARRRGGGDQDTVDKIGGLIERFETTERDLAELGALSAHYRGRLALTADEVGHLLAITGEYGTSCGARVGLGDDAPAGSIVAEAQRRVEHWSRRLADPLIDRRTEQSARVILRSLERVAFHAKEAARHLALEV